LCRKNNCLIAAGSRGQDRTRDLGRGSVQGSIVGGHAYSILEIIKPKLTTENVKLLKLRNPWGTFEWTGDWSDKSDLWNKYPVKHQYILLLQLFLISLLLPD